MYANNLDTKNKTFKTFHNSIFSRSKISSEIVSFGISTKCKKKRNNQSSNKTKRHNKKSLLDCNNTPNFS